jgi:uncharacterized protein YgfB (UPF0149 family)
MLDDSFTTVERPELETVTGGRVSAGPPQTDPKLLQAIAQLGDTVKQMGAGLSQASQQNAQGMQQMMQQMMQAKGGGPKQ